MKKENIRMICPVIFEICFIRIKDNQVGICTCFEIMSYKMFYVLSYSKVNIKP